MFLFTHFQPAHRARDERMGRVPRAAGEAGQRLDGEPVLPGGDGAADEDPRLPRDLRHGARLRGAGQGLRALHDLAAEEGQTASLL